MPSPKFDSDGFDLDAVTRDDGAVLELGGGVSPATATTTKMPPPKAVTPDDSPLHQSELHKQQGNAEFQQKQWLDAYDCYTRAIHATPGEPAADEILERQEAWNQARQERYRQELRAQDEARRNKKGNDDDNSDNEPTQQPDRSRTERFMLDPPHPHATALATYYCNRAAALLHMERYDHAIEDCNLAIILNPAYVKAYIRRSTAYEQLQHQLQHSSRTGDDNDDEDTSANENIAKALQDVQQALQLDPSNAQIRSTVARLQKLEDARLEKLKVETMDKLKDLGNSILGNFGLSLDNFQTQKDPNTGSYSISFNQNK